MLGKLVLFCFMLVSAVNALYLTLVVTECDILTDMGSYHATQSRLQKL